MIPESANYLLENRGKTLEKSMYSQRDFTETDHDVFAEQGYLRLGQVLSARTLGDLQQRIDDIMMGTADIDYEIWQGPAPERRPRALVATSSCRGPASRTPGSSTVPSTASRAWSH